MVTAERGERKMSNPVEKRRSTPSLPTATAGTVEAARRAANSTIANIITMAATGSQPSDSKMECDIPAIPGTSRGVTGNANSGSSNNSTAGTAAGVEKNQQDGATGTKDSGSNYKNLRQGVAGTGSTKKSVMYEEIMVQRRIRGEHAALGLGPGADMFQCGDFYSM